MGATFIPPSLTHPTNSLSNLCMLVLYTADHLLRLPLGASLYPDANLSYVPVTKRQREEAPSSCEAQQSYQGGDVGESTHLMKSPLGSVRRPKPTGQ